MSLASRRRAIYTGLAGHFAGDDLLAILCLWEDRYADKPPFALNEFLAEVAAARGQRLERAKLYRELVGALTGPLSALLPDPVTELVAWRQRCGRARKCPRAAGTAQLLPDEQGHVQSSGCGSG